MSYKKSQFNVEVKQIEDGMLVFNTLTTAVLWVPNDYWKLNKYSGPINSDWQSLIDSGLWVSASENEHESLRSLTEQTLSEPPESIQITIAPTYACNMRCDYCFQTENNEIIMSKLVADKIFDSITCIILKYKKVNISWFGGEPLLAIDIIEYLSKKLIDFCNRYQIQYSADIITNGTLLSQTIARRLAQVMVSQAQITLDGKHHDLTRKMKNGLSSYDLIFQNIVNASAFFAVVVRSNVTESNKVGIKEMIDELMIEQNLAGKIYFSFAPVSSFAGKTAKLSNHNHCCSLEKYSEILAELIEHVSKYQSIQFVTNTSFIASSVVCDALYRDTSCFDAYGDVYKCALAMQNKEMKIGNILDSPIENILNNGDQNGWLTFGWDDSCINCSFLPLCHSGCIFEKRASGRNKICTLNKFIHKNVVEALYKFSEE